MNHRHCSDHRRDDDDERNVLLTREEAADARGGAQAMGRGSRGRHVVGCSRFAASSPSVRIGLGAKRLVGHQDVPTRESAALGSATM